MKRLDIINKRLRERNEARADIKDFDEVMLEHYRPFDETILEYYRPFDETVLEYYRPFDEAMLEYYRPFDEVMLEYYRPFDEVMLEYYRPFDEVMLEYYGRFANKIKPLPPEPVVSDFYHPSENQKNGELLFVVVGTGIATYAP